MTGVLWYLAGTLIWALFIGVLVSGMIPLNEVDSTVAAAWEIGFWLPYVTLLAVGELVFFKLYPHRKAPFIIFAGAGPLIFALMFAVRFGGQRWLSLVVIWPAVAVTALYLWRRSARAIPR